ncbi:putative ribonuclease H-like domain-containing protein [Tanacetum coccineum]
MSAKDKSGLGYGDQIHKGVLSYENEVFESVFDSRSSDVEDSHVNDRFAQSKTSESSESNSSVETLEYMPEPVVIEPKVVIQPKVWSDAPIIEEYESDSDDEYVINPFSHLIRYYDFHEKRMAKQAELNKKKGTGQGEIRPVWNNVQRLNHQHKFVPTAVLTKIGRFPVNAARQNFSSQAVSTSTARKVNTVRPIANETRPRNNYFNTAGDKAVSAVGGKGKTAVKTSAGCNWRPKKHMTGNKAYLAEYQDYNGSHVAFGGSKCYITGKGKIRTEKLDFEDVCFVKELQHFNLFSVSQMCDKKNKVLFTDTECLVLSPDFKLPDENQVLLRIPRQNNMYSFNLENIVPTGGLACLIAKATIDESNKWHRRLGYVNIKNLIKLVKGNLIRGLPFKIFQNDHTCVACKKREQHKASCLVRCDNGTKFNNMDIIEFCGSKGIKREYSNTRTPQQNGVAERKNRTLIEAARTMLADLFLPNTFWAEAVSTACYVLNRVLVTKPQNKTPYALITGKIPIISYIRPFGCHVTILNTIDHLGKFEEKSDEGFLVRYSLNSKAFRVYNLETKRVEEKSHIKFLENKPNVARKGPNWLFDLDYLTDSMNYQPVTAENKANKTVGPKEANSSAGTQDNIDTGYSEKEVKSAQEYCVLPLWSSYTSTVKSSKAKNRDENPKKDTGSKSNEKPVDQEEQAFLEELERLKRQEKKASDAAEALRKEFAQDIKDLLLQAEAARATSTNTINTVSTPVSTASTTRVFSAGESSYPDSTNYVDQDDSQIPAFEDIYDNLSHGIFTNASYDDEGAVTDFTNLETTVNVSPIPTSRIHTIHPTTQILGDPTSAVQTRRKVKKSSRAHAFVSYIQKQRRNNHKDFQHLQEELLQFKIQKMDVKSAFLYGKIDEEVYVAQPSGFVDPKYLKKVYKVVKDFYG